MYPICIGTPSKRGSVAVIMLQLLQRGVIRNARRRRALPGLNFTDCLVGGVIESLVNLAFPLELCGTTV